ncbi:MAG: hypothetical protein KA717_18325 [Woronichinia naegeliana WA131]|uniref:Uncharacterized protein n=1 Tax=Woronichinia naegeliana WA131 TaxID=2824559 RepID=A0A977L2A0_9CYAN|nr:MAG: hypothetical protein KA717_18325 [Woronichinia naegeliana WA131]
MMDSSRKIKVKNGVKLTFLTKTDYIGAIEQTLNRPATCPNYSQAL